MLQKNYERKEISMQNDEHGPVDSSRLFCWLFLCNSVFSLSTPVHLSRLFTTFLSLLFSPCLCLCPSLPRLSPSLPLPSPAPALLPSQARSEVAAPVPPLAPCGWAGPD